MAAKKKAAAKKKKAKKKGAASSKKAAPKKSAAKKPAAKKAAKKPATKKVARKKASATASAEQKPAATSSAASSTSVTLGHVFALRPRVNTSFRPPDFARAKRALEDESFSTIEDATRAVAEKALELTRGDAARPLKRRGR